MIVLGCDSITLSFGSEVVLDNLTFSVNEGDRLGIVGANGAGKTSLFRVIRDEVNYTGNVFISSGSTIGILYQNPIVESENTLFDELIQVFHHKIENDYDIYDYKYQVDTILHKLGFSDEEFTKKVNSFSGGQKTRIALGKLLLLQPDILLLDEPTNHLDVDTLYWLLHWYGFVCTPDAAIRSGCSLPAANIHW